MSAIFNLQRQNVSAIKETSLAKHPICAHEIHEKLLILRNYNGLYFFLYTLKEFCIYEFSAASLSVGNNFCHFWRIFACETRVSLPAPQSFLNFCRLGLFYTELNLSHRLRHVVWKPTSFTGLLFEKAKANWEKGWHANILKLYDSDYNFTHNKK